jgi:hypothetical protein
VQVSRKSPLLFLPRISSSASLRMLIRTPLGSSTILSKTWRWRYCTTFIPPTQRVKQGQSCPAFA